MTTAVLATYYPPRRRLTVSYAGHPTGWLFERTPARGHDSASRYRRRNPAHADVTFLLAEFVEGPPGPALWHVFKHRLLRQEQR